MSGPKIKLFATNDGVFATNDGVVHWSYPMAGQLTVCGLLGKPMKPTYPPHAAPTCFRCIALVQADKQGNDLPWGTGDPDPTRKLG